MEDEVTVNISDQHYTLYEGGLRDVHFDANISTDEAQGIIDDIQQNIQSINQRNSCVFFKQSNDTGGDDTEVPSESPRIAGDNAGTPWRETNSTNSYACSGLNI